jgi:hypothetical protein
MRTAIKIEMLKSALISLATAKASINEADANTLNPVLGKIYWEVDALQAKLNQFVLDNTFPGPKQAVFVFQNSAQLNSIPAPKNFRRSK